MQQKSKPLTLGMIPYWNLLPFISELNNDHGFRIDVKFGVPTKVNHWLQNKEVDIAPCSSLCLARPGYEMALPMGVSSHGPVDSVYLGFRQGHKGLLEFIKNRIALLKPIFAQARSRYDLSARLASSFIWREATQLKGVPLSESPAINFSSSSASSVALTKILYTLCFGEEAYQLMASRKFAPLHSEQAAVDLLIGNDALIHRPSYYKVVDLSAVWHELSSYPFVFAVWQSQGLCLNGWRKKLQMIGELAESKMRVEPSDYFPAIQPKDIAGNPISLADYWKKIHYKLGTREFKGLLLFLCLEKKCARQELDHEIAVKITRWQRLAENA